MLRVGSPFRVILLSLTLRFEQPAKRYERDKRIIDSVFFETIVFEEFKRPVYVDELDWTSRTTVRVSTPIILTSAAKYIRTFVITDLDPLYSFTLASRPLLDMCSWRPRSRPNLCTWRQVTSTRP